MLNNITQKLMENKETFVYKLQSLVVEWHQRQLHYQDVAENNITHEHTNRKFNYKAMATRDCWKELLTLLNETKKDKQEIVGYKLKSHIDRKIVDNILKNSMPIWNDKDKSVYFIRGHVAGSLVAKMKELQVLDLWFTPIYENEEVKSDWIKQNHLDYYYKEGIMSNKSKQETLEEATTYQQELFNYLQDLGVIALQLEMQEIERIVLKMQQEIMYTEEEVLQILTERCKYFSTTIEPFNKLLLKQDLEWFEQFKKK